MTIVTFIRKSIDKFQEFELFKLYDKWPTLVFKNRDNQTSTVKRKNPTADLTVQITNYPDNLTFQITEVIHGEVRDNTRHISFVFPQEVKQELINMLLPRIEIPTVLTAFNPTKSIGFDQS